MCIPMTRFEAGGDRVGAVARSILVIAHALSRRAGPSTTSVATTSPTAQTPPGSLAASALTLTARPPCDLKAPVATCPGWISDRSESRWRNA
jgi:hypothetical protein